ncbi:MAG: phospho-sugar mutase, partial [Planctomycetota bacterium]
DKQGRNLLHFQLGEFARIALRPSGTEPKAKAYIEVSSPPRGAGVSDEAWKAVCAKVDLQAQALGDAFVKMIM